MMSGLKRYLPIILHGYIFKSDFWNDFFSTFTWYSGEYPADSFDTGVFNEYEKANLKLAVEMEK